MSAIVKGNVAGNPELREVNDTQFVRVSVIENHDRYNAESQTYVKTGEKTVYDINFSGAMAARVAASFHTGDAVLVEVENLRTHTFQGKNGAGVSIRARGVDIGISCRYQAFGN